MFRVMGRSISDSQRRAMFANMAKRKTIRSSSKDWIYGVNRDFKIPLNKLLVKVPDSDEDLDGFMSAMQINSKIKQKWERRIKSAICTGEMSVEQAKTLGFRGDEKYEPLPPVLYHTTSNLRGIQGSGFHLKTRNELEGDDSAALGGGTSDTISFTTDRKIAEAIKTCFLEAHAILTDKTAFEKYENNARKGLDAKKPYFNEMMKLIDVKNAYSKLKTGYYIEREIIPKSKKEVPASWKPIGEGYNGRYYQFKRPVTPEERDEELLRFYKVYSFMREQAGGMYDPLIWGYPIKTLKALKPNDVAVLICKPANQNCKGYRVSAMGEWRTNTGKAVKIVGVE